MYQLICSDIQMFYIEHKHNQKYLSLGNFSVKKSVVR